jgi:hypothetical protein
MTQTDWRPTARGVVKIFEKMNGENFYGEDENGVRFCVNPTSRLNKNLRCEKINKLFDLGFEAPRLVEGISLYVEVKQLPDTSTRFDWMAACCKFDLQPPEIQSTIERILQKGEEREQLAIATIPKRNVFSSDDAIQNCIDKDPRMIIAEDVSFAVAPVEEVNNKISIQNAFLSQILRAVAKEHNVHISHVAAACVKYCIANDSILFRMKFNNELSSQKK